VCVYGEVGCCACVCVVWGLYSCFSSQFFFAILPYAGGINISAPPLAARTHVAAALACCLRVRGWEGR
jgi:hypothetical protein